MTGTTITANEPIAVFAGDNLALVPDDITSNEQPLVQEQIPVADWGTNVLSLSFAGRMNGDTYRILAVSNDTVITIIGAVVNVISENPPYGPWSVTTSYQTNTFTTNAGQVYEIKLDGPVQFQASQPIQVAQFANGNESDALPGDIGDPCEILLPPTGNYLTSYSLVAPTNISTSPPYGIGFVTNFLNFIVPQSATNSTMVDDITLAATNFVPIGSSGYYGAQIAVTNGTHTVTSSQPVGVEAYGFGSHDAYGYYGGIVK